MSVPALELRNVTRRFGHVVALADATLTLRERTIHALLGENGAGKTTLMRIAYGLLAPHGGVIRVNGAARTFHSPSDAIASGVGMVQQHPSNVGALTVWQNVVLGGSGGLNPAKAERAVRDLIEQTGFRLDPNARVADLPVAAQQRLEIVKAIHRRARILIMDEPTAILAPEEAKELYAWLRNFVSTGGSAVVVTHKLEEARQFTDDLTVLRAGRTVLEAASASMTAADLTRAMIGDAPDTLPRRAGTAPGDVVLRAESVSIVDVRQVSVVRDATFEIRAGEIVGVAGVEGSGHHELLLAMAGRVSPTTGHIDRVSRTSIIPEDRHRDAIVLEFSLTENAAIEHAGSRRGVLPWRRLAARVREVMTAFDVRASGPDVIIQELSGGNQQKFVLARGLADNPQLVIAENPTRGLDVRASSFVRERLRAARDSGAAVVLYSSDLDEIIDLADRVLVVQGGRVSEVPRDRTRIGAAMLGAA